jgi:hypothetical protein
MVLGPVILADTPHSPFSNSTLRIHLRCSNVKFTNVIFFYTNYCHLADAPTLRSAHCHVEAFYSNPCKIQNFMVIYMRVVSVQSVYVFWTLCVCVCVCVCVCKRVKL